MVEDHTERKLAAILAADVAGFSRLMSADEEGTLARLRGHLRELVEPAIAAHRGRIVKRMGSWSTSRARSRRCAVGWRCRRAWPSATVACQRRSVSISASG